jgi:hypothetical protein
MRSRKLTSSFLALSLCVLIPIAGCNKFADAQNTIGVIAQIVSTAQSDLPSLQASGVFTAAEAIAVTNYLGAVSLLDTQAGTCLTAIGKNGANAALVACFTTFANGLVSPAELADLRVLNPKAQARVQLWVTAFALAINAGAEFFGGATSAPPQIADQPAQQADLAVLRARLNLPASYGE